MKLRIAIITPRFGRTFGGGAETQAYGFAREAARRDWSVEIWTTCARSHYTWYNELPPGQTSLDDLTIIRFPVTHWDRTTRAQLETRLNLCPLPRNSQYDWLATGPHSAPLYRHVANYAAQFDVLVMLPYTNPLIHFAAQIMPERTVVWPCLHDEAYAYLEPVRLLLESVWGVMFNTPEEQELAVELLRMAPRRHTVLGEGVLFVPESGPTNAVNNSLLYVGRLEEGKNLRELYRFVQQAYDMGLPVGLNVIGGGPLVPPNHPAFVYRGFVSDEAKAEAYANALALCQPSLKESFSLVMMESWLAGRPVLVDAGCAVTHGHIRRSKGGLAYAGYEEFVGAVDWLQDHPDRATQMGENGRYYVRSNYMWPAVADRFACIISQWRNNNGLP